jgi:hypothetical protein
MKTNNAFSASLLLAVFLSAAAKDAAANTPPALPDKTSSVLSIENPPDSARELLRPPAAGKTFLLNLILNPKADIRDRLEAVQEVGHDLDRSEVQICYWFLKNHPGSQEKNPAGLRTLKNNLINTLKSQKLPPVGLTETLIDIFHDRGQDFVMRDYAIQHLASWGTRQRTDSPDAAEQIQKTIREALWQKSSIAGTALLGMQRLSKIDTNLNSEIDRNAVRLVTSSDTGPAARITAIQVCAERGLDSVLPQIEKIAAARGQTASQISAIAALAKLGKQDDVTLLQKLAREKDPALSPAIASAMKSLTHTLARRDNF